MSWTPAVNIAAAKVRSKTDNDSNGCTWFLMSTVLLLEWWHLMISLFSTVPTKELQSESADENQIWESAIPPKELQSEWFSWENQIQESPVPPKELQLESAKNPIAENRSLTSCAFSLVIWSFFISSQNFKVHFQLLTTHVTAAAIWIPHNNFLITKPILNKKKRKKERKKNLQPKKQNKKHKFSE